MTKERQPGIGFPNRSADFDAYPGFVSPPEGYGEVAFYWWVGEKLTKERLEWQLEQLKDHHVTGLQINYAHTDEGGDSWGLTIQSDPPLFSEEWWELFAWFAKKAGSCGMTVSLSDYTLCSPGQGWYTDEILAKKPDIAGTNLVFAEWKADEGRSEWELPDNTISVIARRYSASSPDAAEWMDLAAYAQDSVLHWRKPEGSWSIVAVYGEVKERSIDPMHPEAGALVIRHFFQRFEDRLGGIPEAKLGFFFSDELEFGIKGRLWNDGFRETFKQRKGYDIVPELAALFVDIGPRTPKIRLDYGDVMVALSEENYFVPVFEWHEQRGMIYGCDHGGRGKDTTEFGDYFRTQRWNQGPGCDQPNFECDLIKNKVASSIAHLYERPRTWLEGFYGSGWGTNTEDVARAIFRNFVSGHNLLTLHGLYYTTLGGRWEWAPPCNHFRMPYWEHMKPLLACTERLSYLLSQGVHACDAAVLYPVAAMEAGLGGEESVKTAFDIGEYLYGRGIDFDFMDFQSLDRAVIENRELRVAGEAYKVLILPSMRALRHSTLVKALEFREAGGIVIALGRLPEASDRYGASDSDLDGTVRALFGWTAAEAYADPGSRIHRHASGGAAYTATAFEEVEAIVDGAFPRDFRYLTESESAESAESLYVMHRKIGARDIYAVYGAEEGAECFFRCRGTVELWNSWDGSRRRLQPERVSEYGTYVRLPLGPSAIQLVAFSAEGDGSVSTKDYLKFEAAAESLTLNMDGPWEFELRPTMDNRFGDFRQPAENVVIGPEARRFRFMADKDGTADWSDPDLDDRYWPLTAYGYGPYFWKLGALPDTIVSDELEAGLAAMTRAPHGQDLLHKGKSYFWNAYEFSMREGVENDPGHQGYHGLKGEMSDHFLALGRASFTMTDTAYEAEEEGPSAYYLWTSFHSDEAAAKLRLGGNLPDKVWVNGRLIDDATDLVAVRVGMNAMLLRYSKPGRGHALFERIQPSGEASEPYPLSMSWYRNPDVLPFDAFPNEDRPAAGWYRFTAPPGLESLQLTARGDVRVWVDGIEWPVARKERRSDGETAYVVSIGTTLTVASAVAVRIAYNGFAYGGAALLEPIALRCGQGRIALGDWSKIDGLSCYSGGAVYRKTLEWPLAEAPEACIAELDLGEVSATAEVRVNGQYSGTLLSRPWKLDIAKHLRPGANNIEVEVRNTLANHYATIPTRYRGDPKSGLIGPVSLRIASKAISDFLEAL